ncbi:MAG: hypothetical protein GF349_05105 [Candidatus Magasanikbacteria bacterium]|nr:hypothetical protein [Candidatus Magasanikbacteria bacterium]
MQKKFKKKGFGLVEAIVGTAVFLLFSIGVYSGVQYIYKVVYQSRVRIIESSLLSEELETIRNLSFYDVGIEDGSPSGILPRTATTTRNGIDFIITRTIRNIDDEFDGQLGGSPDDSSPADYRFVELSIICDDCGQQEPITMSTLVSPKYLEGDPDHGGLFIEVLDADANPVQGATVHVLATTTDPTLDLYDTTDNDGMLRLLDLGAGYQAYHITVTKNGYTSDGTVTSSAEIYNPVKPPATVAAQAANERSFEIDLASSIAVSTLNETCQTVSGVETNIYGTKLIGSDPDVLLVNELFSTTADPYTFSNMVWDNYGFDTLNYDLIGSIPSPPIILNPGVNLPVKLIVGPNTNHSLIVSLTDSITGEPVANASVEISDGSTTTTLSTDLGYASQTDWSGGSGQLNMSDPTRYWTQDNNIEVGDPAGDLKLKFLGSYYMNSGELESSIFDLGISANFVDIAWSPFAQPLETGSTSVKMQMASSNTSTPGTWDYYGPDGSSGTYYDKYNTDINDVHDGDQYIRYKMYLETASTSYTPTVSDLSINYSSDCTPPGSGLFG